MAAAILEGASMSMKASAAPSNLALRTMSAMVMLPVALVALWLGGWPFFALVALAGILMLGEWSTICRAPRPLLWQAAVSAPLLYLLWLVTSGAASDALGWAVISVVAVAAVVARADKWDINWAVTGALYIGLPTAALLWLRNGAVPGDAAVDALRGFRLVIWVFCLVWASDIFAYIAGRSIGGPKLAPAISPGKTWAGFFGGTVGAAVVGGIIAQFFDAASVGAVALISAVLAVLAQVGDLAESAFKRRFGVKDSGSLIPGHGGVLDRVDALLFVAMAVAIGEYLDWRLW